MEKKIQKLKDHYIVCGGGQTGRPVLAELIVNGEPVVLIEQSEESIERCKAIVITSYSIHYTKLYEW